MASINLPYVQICRAKGRDYAYYRRGGIRQRIAARIGSAEFYAAYQTIHSHAEAQAKQATAEHRVVVGSFKALWLAYTAASEFTGLAQSTQQSYRRLIEPLFERWGELPVDRLPPQWIMKRMDEMGPAKANHFLPVLRLLLNWSIPRGWVKSNPAAGIKRAKHKPNSHRAWTADELATMTGLDAGLIALPVMIALHTGQRLADVLALPWSAYDGSTITVAAQGKTKVRVVIPVLPELRQALEAAPRRAVVICTRQDGHAWKTDHFKHAFADKRDALGQSKDLHFHGLRHLAGRRLAEAGCTPQEIAAILGHKTLAMVTLYTAQAGQEVLARAAITKLEEHNKNKSRK